MKVAWPSVWRGPAGFVRTLVLAPSSTLLALLVSVLGFAVVGCRQSTSKADATGTRSRPGGANTGLVGSHLFDSIQ